MSPTDISLQGPDRANSVTMPSSELKSFGISKILFYESVCSHRQCMNTVDRPIEKYYQFRNIINSEILSIYKYCQFRNIINLEILSI